MTTHVSGCRYKRHSDRSEARLTARASVKLDIMKMQVIPLAVLLGLCTGAPIFQPQLGIIASNSNEIVRLNGITLAGVGTGQAQQRTPFLSSFLFQQQPDILLPQQFLNFGPQMTGPFLPPQQNQLTPVVLPPNQQEQPTVLKPNNPPVNQNPAQVVPQFYPFPQGPRGQGFPYYLMYGFPPGNTLVRPPPNQNTVSQNPIIPTPGPLKPAQNNIRVSKPWRLTPPPDNRGDRPGVDGDPAFSFFEP